LYIQIEIGIALGLSLPRYSAGEAISENHLSIQLAAGDSSVPSPSGGRSGGGRVGELWISACT
jgi:hypothetical protein